jgi:hypothetical protein
MYRMGGHHGYGWGRHGHHGGFGFFWMFPMLLLMGFLFFGLLKFFWPLLLIGLIFAAIKFGKHGGHGWKHGDWSQQWKHKDWAEKWQHYEGDWKRKNDDLIHVEKPKREDRRFTRTADGDIVEII